VSIRDITDLTLRHLQEQFLALVCHELRAPVNVAIIAIDLLAKQLPRKQGSKVQELIDTLRRQLQDMQLMVEDLSDLGRIQREEFQFAFEPIDLVPLIEQVLDRLRLLPSEDEPRPPIVFTADPSASSVSISGDPLRIEQIVTNLVTNAMKYAPRSEHIDVRLRQVGGNGDGKVELQVQDYGPGIPAADRPHLFSPFSHVARPGGQQQPGLGLGLFISQSLAKAHGGIISVESKMGVGTTFTVTLPVLPTTDVPE
jgi:two-component system CheB/CheR fusion protein